MCQQQSDSLDCSYWPWSRSVLLFTKKKATVQRSGLAASASAVRTVSQWLNDAPTEAMVAFVASKLQWYGFQQAFPLKISLCGAWECSPAVFRGPGMAFPRVPFDHCMCHTIFRCCDVFELSTYGSSWCLIQFNSFRQKHKLVEAGTHACSSIGHNFRGGRICILVHGFCC